MAYTPYVALVACVAALTCLLLRRWAAAAVAVLAAVSLLAVIAPRLRDNGGPGDSGYRPMRVMSANLLKGRGQPEQLLALARERDVELLAVQELTTKIARDLDRIGIREQFPHAVLTPRLGVSGGGIYSRYPAVRKPSGYLDFTQTRAAVEAPRGLALDVVSVHPVPPARSADIEIWKAGLDSLPSVGEPGVQLLLGDFNATLDHAELREILDDGYDDAGEQTGRGLTPTWPDIAKPFRYMPVTIDHLIYESDLASADDYEVLDLEGSDHRPVFAELFIREPSP